MRSISATGLGLLAIIFATSVSASAADVTVTIENVGDQPITSMFMVTHNEFFDLFDEDAAAAPALVTFVDTGDASDLDTAAGDSTDTLDATATTVSVGPGQMTTLTLQAGADHPYLSIVARLQDSPDTFIGFDDGFDLYRGGKATNYDFTVATVQIVDQNLVISPQFLGQDIARINIQPQPLPAGDDGDGDDGVGDDGATPEPDDPADDGSNDDGSSDGDDSVDSGDDGDNSSDQNAPGADDSLDDSLPDELTPVGCGAGGGCGMGFASMLPWTIAGLVGLRWVPRRRIG